MKQLSRVAALLSVVILIWCSSPASIKPFTTDGCSLFPDSSLISNQDWCNCCLMHDLAYWRGGTADERLKADKSLQACVENTTGNKALAELMLVGVRTGGGPYYFTTYRWGYGWPYGREYKPLTAEESLAADRAEKDFRSTRRQLSCETAMSRP